MVDFELNGTKLDSSFADALMGIPSQVIDDTKGSLSVKINTERVELVSKIEKLKTFMALNGEWKNLTTRHQQLLSEQLDAMENYESVLVKRLRLLNNN